MATLLDRTNKLFEGAYPHCAGFVAAGLAIWQGSEIAQAVAAHSLKLDQAYSGVFGLASVLTGFLFTFYSFVLTTDRGFLGKARSSIYLRRTSSFTVTALVAGTVAALVSLPMMIWQPVLTSTMARTAFGIWFGTSIWAILAFERAARLFIIFCNRHNR
ncbi:hypothetical protein [Brevundimonas sp. P7753]|uniref:hypothetical protein n=1 Tax=Brevundimonas sp. P7753 TaxID=2726982 RepID=UPI0015BAE6E9|nr:hypothetical protein [Brevundimonas sp. P7753]NWE51574.1 hypothetical protein [Brevundimonas sp. P7753]